MQRQQQHKRHLQEDKDEEKEEEKRKQLQKLQQQEHPHVVGGSDSRVEAAGRVHRDPEEEENEQYEDKEEDMYSEEFEFDDDSDGGEALRLAGSVATAESRKPVQAAYRSLTPVDLHHRMEQFVQETTELLGVDGDVAGALLRAYRWRLEDLFQEWFYDKAEALKKARLPPLTHSEGSNGDEGDEIVDAETSHALGSAADKRSRKEEGKKPCNTQQAQDNALAPQSLIVASCAANAEKAGVTPQENNPQPSKQRPLEGEAGKGLDDRRMTAPAAAGSGASSSLPASRAPCSGLDKTLKGKTLHDSISKTSSASPAATSRTEVEFFRGRAPSDLFECPVTTLVVPYSDTSALPCGHRFANECWHHFLETALQEGPASAVDKRLTYFGIFEDLDKTRVLLLEMCKRGGCPSYKCGEIVREDFWRRFLYPSSFKRLQSFRIQIFVERNDAFSWCPAPGCGNAVELLHRGGSEGPFNDKAAGRWLRDSTNHVFGGRSSTSQGAPSGTDAVESAGGSHRNSSRGCSNSSGRSIRRSNSSSSADSGNFLPKDALETCEEKRGPGHFAGGDICCACGTRFCLYCSEEPHRPVRCEIIRQWNQKNQNEADNMTWILVHTKNCPRCKQPIEKNQGCMHMTCRCGYEFCWLCLGDWKKHQSSDLFRCNVYEQQPADPNEEKRKKAKESLERYAHFFERYRAHAYGQRVATEKQMSQVRKHMRLLLQGCLQDVSEVEFLEEAVKQIIECRRMLKWSYAYGYFADWEGREPQQKLLFEYHQYELERSLDRLQEKTETFDPIDYLEGEDALEKLQHFKIELTDLTRVIGGFFKNICEVFEHEFCC